jgi:hypothetical protein
MSSYLSVLSCTRHTVFPPSCLSYHHPIHSFVHPATGYEPCCLTSLDLTIARASQRSLVFLQPAIISTTSVASSRQLRLPYLADFGRPISPTSVALSRRLRSPYLVTLVDFSRPTLSTLVALLALLHFTFFFRAYIFSLFRAYIHSRCPKLQTPSNSTTFLFSKVLPTHLNGFGL